MTRMRDYRETLSEPFTKSIYETMTKEQQNKHDAEIQRVLDKINNERKGK